MAAAEPPPQGPCGCPAGAVFLRSCGQPAIGLCGDCALPLCAEHQRSYRWLMLCPACFAKRQQDSGSAGDSESSGYAPSPYGAAGIARESLDAGDDGTEAPSIEEFGDSPFTEEDYAAFDAVSAYDREAERGGGYDS